MAGAAVTLGTEHGGRTWLRWLSRIYLLACGLGLVAVLSLHGDALLELQPQAPAWIPVALLLAALGHGFSVAFIEQFTACVGHRIALPVAAEAHLRFLPARYLPGGVWHTVGRVEQLRRMGLPLKRASVLPAVESLAAVGAAALAGSLLLMLRPSTSGWLAGSACVMLVCAFSLRPTRHGPSHPGAGVAASAVGFWTCQQLAFGCLVLAIASPGIDAPSATGNWVLAWAVGHLAVFAPQGIGVTEAVYARLTSSGVEAAFVVMAYRVLQAVADLLAWMAWTMGCRRVA